VAVEYKYDEAKLGELYRAIGEFIVKYQWVSTQARMLYVNDTRALGFFLHKQFKNLIEKRDLIVHGHWWVGENVITSSTDDTDGFRRLRRKDGMVFEPLPTIDELKKLATHADKLYQALVLQQ
jgi:hypothetical protein